MRYAEVSILVAAKNEERNIRSCLEQLSLCCPEAEIIVIDGGHDQTESIVQALMSDHPTIRYIRNFGDRGKGHAMKVGIAEATGAFIAQVDADLQFPPEQLPLLLEPILTDQADIALGSRFLQSSTRLAGSQNLRRAGGNFVVSGLASLLFRHRMTDVMAGFKAWKRQVTETFSLTSDHYSYEVELAAKAIKHGFRVIDVPIVTAPRRAGVSSVRVFRDGVKTILDIVRFRFC